MDDMKQVTEPLRAFYRDCRLSRFTEKQAMVLTCKYLEVLMGIARERQEETSDA